MHGQKGTSSLAIYMLSPYRMFGAAECGPAWCMLALVAGVPFTDSFLHACKRSVLAFGAYNLLDVSHNIRQPAGSECTKSKLGCSVMKKGGFEIQASARAVVALIIYIQVNGCMAIAKWPRWLLKESSPK